MTATLSPDKPVYEFSYTPDGDVLKAFLRSEKFVRGIRGPVGSGKSVCCAVEIMRRASQQAPDPADGIRYSRWAVIRNTQPELKTTTIKTWLDWYPEAVFGKFNWSPPFTHHIRRYGIDLEVIFLALDQEEDVKKLLSLELTGVWVNEAREVPKGVIDGATGRVYRYPSMKRGGPTWSGLIMDTNSPEDDHWWPIMSGEVPPPEDMTEDDLLTFLKPENWEFFTQPPAMLEKIENKQLVGYELNPDRENRNNLHGNYYPQMIQGKARRWINVYVLNRYGSTQDGLPVYPSYRDEVHGSPTPLPILEGQPVRIGMDFGLTPAVVFAQQTPLGQWLVQREIVTQNMGARQVAPLIRRMLETVYPSCSVIGTGDPAGTHRGQADSEMTVFNILAANGVHLNPAYTNDFTLRVEAVESVLSTMVDGRPRVVFDPSVRVLRNACAGRYRYKRVQVQGGGTRYATEPEKNRYSHVAEALQYLFLGGGEGHALQRPHQPMTVTVAKRGSSPMQRMGRRNW